jgi:superoxide reductase
MTDRNQIWKCEICGNIVEVVHAGADALVCCGQPMTLMSEKTKDIGFEKHVPVIEKLGKNKFKIKIGKIEHPMTPEHHIEWIEVIADGEVMREFLNPGDKPEKEFVIESKKFIARAYCNIHGLWSSKN